MINNELKTETGKERPAEIAQDSRMAWPAGKKSKLKIRF